jgi:hypothetical protein
MLAITGAFLVTTCAIAFFAFHFFSPRSRLLPARAGIPLPAPANSELVDLIYTYYSKLTFKINQVYRIK